jgi:crotonobetainyl-CoA:carnitine CoA-transferase CaiB-like acyl-CoA transferase
MPMPDKTLSEAASSGGPLAGMVVVEFANVLAGPLVGQFCAELGARVIKVEPPGIGDPTRGWYLDAESRESTVTAYFSSANWGKASIALDLGSDGDRDLAARLAARADVVIVGYKPGDERKFGLDYETLRGANPGLIYLQVTAYGSDDPRPGFDAIVQAEAGFTFMNGTPDGPPVKMPVALMDLLAAHQLKEGLLLALLERERSGKGARIATSLLGAATASLANQASNYLRAGVVPGRMGSEHPNIVPYGNIFLTRDGREFVVAVGTERQFREFTAALELDELAADPRFATNAERVGHRETLNGLLAARIAELDADAIEAAMTARKVPFGFVNDMAAVFEQPAARDQCFDAGGGVRTVALDGSVEGLSNLSPPPELDADRAAILDWLNGVGSE